MVLALLGVALSTVWQDTAVVSIDDAVTRAVLLSPAVAAAEGAVQAPRGARAETFWPFPTNPSVEYGRVRRRSPAATVYDRQLVVSQEIEIGGQWLFRRSAAGKLVQSALERVDDVRRRVSLATRLTYLDLAIAERRVALSDSNAVFAERLADLAARQLAAGEINQLERNAAMLEAARAGSAAQRIGATRAAVAARLAEILGVGADTVLKTQSVPHPPDVALESDNRLLMLAVERRSDLTAVIYEVEASERTYTAAKLSLLPNLTIAAFSGREEDTDDLFGLSLGFTVPLFRRGQSARGVAAAERSVAQAELLATQRRIQAEVLAAARRYELAGMAEDRFATDVLRAATANVTLTETALAEGEVSVTDVVVLRTAAVGAQMEYLDVLAEATAAWFELAAALNESPAELATLLNRGIEQ